MRLIPVLLAGLVVSGPTAAAGQPRRHQPAADFGSLTASPMEVEVIDTADRRITGRIVRIDAGALTLSRDGREWTFGRAEVARIYQRRDSLKNGLLTGLAIGGGLGVAGALGTDCGGFWVAVRRCTAGERARMMAVLGGVLGAAGMGIGAGLDAVVGHHRLLYAATPGSPLISIAPAIGHSGAGARATIAW